ncbi:hypothetical protein [Methylorubrum zatmanii]
MPIKLYVLSTLVVATLCCAIGAALGDIDLAGSGVILAVLALVVSRLSSSPDSV